MKNGLIGFTGFVGQNLNINRFDELINSSNIKNYKRQEFDLLVIAAGDARKWYANKNPSIDLLHILDLFEDIKQINAKKIILLSTIDVYPDYLPENKYDENTNLYSDFPYGMHRLMLEKLLQITFSDVSIIRLPGLIGKNLKKNIIYDICNNRLDQLKNYNLDSYYQYFDLSLLDQIIDMVLGNNIYKILNLTSEPISVREIAQTLELEESIFSNSQISVKYDIKTIHCEAGYFLNSNDILTSIKKFYEEY